MRVRGNSGGGGGKGWIGKIPSANKGTKVVTGFRPTKLLVVLLDYPGYVLSYLWDSENNIEQRSLGGTASNYAWLTGPTPLITLYDDGFAFNTSSSNYPYISDSWVAAYGD